MERITDSIFWLRTVAYVAVAGVVTSLVLEGARHLPWVVAGTVAFAAALPMWPWTRKVSAGAFFGVTVVEALLVTLGQFVSGQPGTMMTLFFILLPTCARLPRRYSLLCYTLFPFLACLPYLMAPDARLGWSVVASVVPGFLASIAFSEGFWTYRDTLLAKQKLLDELIDARRREEEGEAEPSGPTPAADPHRAADLLTRRDREVLSLVAMGFSNKEVAERLFLAEGTVKNRVSQILEKIGARDRTQAALRARNLGLL